MPVGLRELTEMCPSVGKSLKQLLEVRPRVHGLGFTHAWRSSSSSSSLIRRGWTPVPLLSRRILMYGLAVAQMEGPPGTIEDLLALTWAVEDQAWGVRTLHELVPGGDQIPVTGARGASDSCCLWEDPWEAPLSW